MLDEAVKVVDASALAALLFGEAAAEAVAERLGEAELVAPALLPFEVASVCWKKRLRHPEIGEALLGGLRRFSLMNVRLVDVEPSASVATAETHGLTPYDASYLWLARYLGVELVTLDAALSAASEKA